MIVRELIAILKQYPESNRIVVEGNEGGYWVDDSQKHEDAVVII